MEQKLSELSNAAVAVALGQKIQALRIAASLNQKQLAEKAGVALVTVSRLETGKGNPTLAAVIAVLRVLGKLDALENLLAPPGPSPIALAQQAKEHGMSSLSGVARVRVRASGKLVAKKSSAEGFWKK